MSGLAVGAGLLLLLALYFTPTIVAFARSAPSVGTVVVLNVFLGWTFVGWVVSLALAMRERQHYPSITINSGYAAPGYPVAYPPPIPAPPPPSMPPMPGPNPPVGWQRPAVGPASAPSSDPWVPSPGRPNLPTERPGATEA